jgi:type I restriction enzyme R subunit
MDLWIQPCARCADLYGKPATEPEHQDLTLKGAIETAQVIEELIDVAKKFRAAATRGEELGLTEDEIRFYDALANNESAVRELTDETLKKIAHELTENLRQNITVDWSERESVRARLRLMVKRILRKYKYPPDQQDGAVDLVLQQAQALGEAWS